jgi:hypothetical protein
MRLTNLSVELLQGQASITLMKQAQPATAQRPNFTNININVPIEPRKSETEEQLRDAAVERAKQALREAIAALEAYQLIG